MAASSTASTTDANGIRIKGFLGTADEITKVAEVIAPKTVEWVRSLTDAEIIPMGVKALGDIADDILVLDEIRTRFRRGHAIEGYANWTEFVEKNSKYGIRTIQKRLATVNGKDESKINKPETLAARHKPIDVPLPQFGPALNGGRVCGMGLTRLRAGLPNGWQVSHDAAISGGQGYIVRIGDETHGPFRESEAHAFIKESRTDLPTTTTTSAIMDEILRAKKPLAGYLYVWEKTTIESADKSYLWLVENQKTGRAELWRTHELTRIIKTGEVKRRQNCEVAYGHTDSPAFRAYGLLYIAAAEEWAQRRLQELKGLRSDVGDFIPPVNPADQQELKETAAPAVEDPITDAVNFPTEPEPAAAIKPKPKSSEEFLELQRLAKDAGYHLATSVRDGKYDVLGLTAAQVKMFIHGCAQ